MNIYVKKISSVFLAMLSILFLFQSCAFSGKNSSEYVSEDFIAMDTYLSIKLSLQGYDKDGKRIDLDDEYLNALFEECENIVNELDAKLSCHDDNSIISEINGEVDKLFYVDEEVAEIISNSIDISKQLNGAFDPTVGSATLLWNITSESASVPSNDEIQDSLSHIGNDKIEINGDTVIKHDRKTKLDFGAVAKGYALQKIINYLNTTFVSNAVINFGGSVALIGNKSDESLYKIGITSPEDKSSVIGYVYIDGGFVSVSGNYERYAEIEGVKYDHIFDPFTAMPCVSDITSVTVLCGNGVLADALSTALYVMGYDAASEFCESTDIDFEAVFTLANGETKFTDGIKSSNDENLENDDTYVIFEEYAAETDN